MKIKDDVFVASMIPVPSKIIHDPQIIVKLFRIRPADVIYKL